MGILKEKLKYGKRGITLIALVITIVVLLILASVTIYMLTGQNNLLSKTEDTKNNTEISEEKEKIKLAVNADLITNEGKLNTKEGLQTELDNIELKKNTHVIKDGKDKFIITFLDTNRNYKIDKNRNIEGPIDIELIEDTYAGDITKNGTLDGESNPYLITCIEDLISFSKLSETNNFENKKVVLERNLDFESELSYVYNDTSFGDVNEDGIISELLIELTTGKGFKPINDFYGNFNGNNNIIYNLYINRKEENVGFFKALYNGKISKLGIENMMLKNGEKIGGITAVNNSGIIENCHVSGRFAATCSKVGGIVAEARGGFKIEKCYVIADMINAGHIGGIIGACEVNGRIIECYHRGIIEGNENKKSLVGGIVGSATGDIVVKNCYHIGDIKGKEQAGGIVGFFGGDIFNCYSIGNITSTYMSGIIHGMNYGNHIVHCFGRREDAENLSEGELTELKIIKSLSQYNNKNYGHKDKAQIGYKCNILFDEEMKSINFVNNLNILIEAGTKGENEGIISESVQNIWKEDINNINNGYPIFNWQ